MAIRKQQAEEKEAHREDLQNPPAKKSIHQVPDSYKKNHIHKSLNYMHKPGILLGAIYC